MQLIRDNLTLWTSELEEEEGKWTWWCLSLYTKPFIPIQIPIEHQIPI
jgi:hypothetical protein